MAASSKPEFPPLLPVGFHQLTVAELTQRCVDDFHLSPTRLIIMKGLSLVIRRLQGARIAGELWVDGSFVTEKIDPKDSDVVLVIDHAFYDSGTVLQKKTIEWISANLKAKHLCDSYVTFDYPVGHPYHMAGVEVREYWARTFGLSRKDDPKGIAVVKC